MKRIKLALLAAVAFLCEPIAKYAEKHFCFYVYAGSTGTTAGTSDANPPVLLVRGMGAIMNGPGNRLGSAANAVTSVASTNAFSGGTGLWYYCSSDSATIASSPGYFTDGLQLGMRVGDVIFNVSQSSYGTSPALGVGVLGTTNSTAGFNQVAGAVIQNS